MPSTELGFGYLIPSVKRKPGILHPMGKPHERDEWDPTVNILRRC
jgi:hypothetical protein